MTLSEPQSKKYDLIVIGSGPAGEKAAVKAAYFGHKVALIEKAKALGGAGTNTGTLPSKTLKESALYYSGKYDKGIYGNDRDFEGSTTIEDFMYRKNVVIDSVQDEIHDNLERHNVDMYQGVASFVDEHTVCVEGAESSSLYGEFIIIATGSYPFQPANIDFNDARVHDSDSILHLNDIPKSLCIVGAGVIGCEYATIFAALGTKVFLVNNQDSILTFLDIEISNALVKQMQDDDIEILFNASIAELKIPNSAESDLIICMEDGHSFEVNMYLFAAGRSGTTAQLQCEKAGVELGRRETVIVNDNYQTSQSNIYAVGDVIGFPALASTSMDQGRVAVSHIFDTQDLDAVPKVFPYGIYTIPEVSMVGLSEEEAAKEGLDYVVGRSRHPKVARGRIMGAKSGLMKIIVSKDDRIIRGVHIIGQMSSELIHYGLALVQDKKSIDEVISTVFNYPTLHDLYKYACYDALGNLSGHKIKEF